MGGTCLEASGAWEACPECSVPKFTFSDQSIFSTKNGWSINVWQDCLPKTPAPRCFHDVWQRLSKDFLFTPWPDHQVELCGGIIWFQYMGMTDTPQASCKKRKKSRLQFWQQTKRSCWEQGSRQCLAWPTTIVSATSLLSWASVFCACLLWWFWHNTGFTDKNHGHKFNQHAFGGMARQRKLSWSNTE